VRAKSHSRSNSGAKSHSGNNFDAQSHSGNNFGTDGEEEEGGGDDDVDDWEKEEKGGERPAGCLYAVEEAVAASEHVVSFESPFPGSLISTCALQGYLAHKKPPPPQDYHRAIGIGLM